MTSTETRGRNVLDQLDQRVPTSFYWSLTLLQIFEQEAETGGGASRGSDPGRSHGLMQRSLGGSHAKVSHG